MGADTSLETMTSAMSRDALEILKAALDDNRDKVKEVLGSFVDAILEETLNELRKLLETFLRELPYVTEEQEEALTNDLVNDILESITQEDCSSLEALHAAVARVRRALEEKTFEFSMPKLPGVLELEENEIENAAWEAAQDAFRVFWDDLRPLRQGRLEIEFRREFQRLTEGMFPKKES